MISTVNIQAEMTMHDLSKQRSGQSQTHSPWWALDARRLLVAALFLALFAMSARETRDPDLWWHLATGRAIVETRAIPRHDPFSYTVPGRPWVTHEWLAQVGMYALYRLGGLPALLLATCAVVTLAFALVYLQCEARPHLAVFVVLLGALASAVAWGPRPQMLTMCLAALFTYLLDRYRAGRRRVLWLYPALTTLWVNLHSGFFLGLALIGFVLLGEWAAYWLDWRTPETLSRRQMRDLALALGACVLAALLNPNGWRILAYPFETLGSQAMQRYIQEWASPDFHRPEYWPLALLLLGGGAGMALSARRRSLTDVGLLFGFGAAALHAARHIPLFAVLAAPIVTRYVSKRPPPQEAPTPTLAHRNGFPRAPQGPRTGEGEEPPPRPSPVLPTEDGRTTGEGEERAAPAGGRPSLPPPRACPHFGQASGGTEGGQSWLTFLNYALLLLLTLGAAARVAWVVRENREVEAAHYPVAALDWIEANGLADRRVYNAYHWGGYLLWRGYPVFVDGRADVYGDAFLDEYVLAYQLRGDWRQPLERYRVDYVLIERGASLEALLVESDEWQRVYGDELAVVFVRQDRSAIEHP